MKRTPIVRLGPYMLKLGEERILPATGLAVMGQLVGRSVLTAEADTLKLTERPEPDIPNRDVIMSYLGMLAQGHTEYSAVNMLLEDEEASRLSLCLSVRIPSEGTLRQRIDQIGDRLRSPILRSNVDIFRKNMIHPSTNAHGYIPVDVDVTPWTIPTQKNRVSAEPTPVMTATHRSSPISVRKVT